MHARERKHVRGDHLRVATDAIDVRHALGVLFERIARHDHREVAPARVGGKLVHKVVDHRAVEAVANHDAIDVARAKVAACGIERECAGQSHALADRYRQGRKVAAAACDEHGRVLERIVLRKLGPVVAFRCLFQPAQRGRVQRAHAQRGAQARNELDRDIISDHRNDMRRGRRFAGRHDGHDGNERLTTFERGRDGKLEIWARRAVDQHDRRRTKLRQARDAVHADRACGKIAPLCQRFAHLRTVVGNDNDRT